MGDDAFRAGDRDPPPDECGGYVGDGWAGPAPPNPPTRAEEGQAVSPRPSSVASVPDDRQVGTAAGPTAGPTAGPDAAAFDRRILQDLALVLAGALLLIGLVPFLAGTVPAVPPPEAGAAGEAVRSGAVPSIGGLLPLFWFLVLGLGATAVRRWDDLRREADRRGAVERALEATRARWQAYVAHAPDIILTVDREGRILHLNRGPPGYDAGEVVGTTVYDHVVPGERHVVARHLERAFERGEPVRYEVRSVAADGRPVWYESVVGPVAVRGRCEEAVIVARDVTESRRAKEALEQSRSELERRNRDLRALAFAASHDLQECLREVGWSVDALLAGDGAALDEQTRGRIEQARRTVARTHGVLNDLLTFAEVGTGPPPRDRVDLATCLEEALARVAPRLADTDTEVTSDPLPTVTGDARELRLLLAHLLDNALKFRDDGGDGDAGGDGPSAPPRVHVGCARHDGTWHLTVEDDGIGIDPGHGDRLFEVFYRLHPREAYDGAGVGLAICRKVVDRHGGRIWYASVPGEGTTVHVALPADRGGPGDGAGSEETPGAGPPPADVTEAPP